MQCAGLSAAAKSVGLGETNYPATFIRKFSVVAGEVRGIRAEPWGLGPRVDKFRRRSPPAAGGSVPGTARLRSDNFPGGRVKNELAPVRAPIVSMVVVKIKHSQDRTASQHV